MQYIKNEKKMKVVEKSCWFGKNELAQWHTHTHTHRERERGEERRGTTTTYITHTQNRLSQHKKIYQMILMGLHSQFFFFHSIKCFYLLRVWSLCVCVCVYCDILVWSISPPACTDLSLFIMRKELKMNMCCFLYRWKYSL